MAVPWPWVSPLLPTALYLVDQEGDWHVLFSNGMLGTVLYACLLGFLLPLQALLARSKALEDQLMALCAEKTNLEAEFARMPLGAGRNLRERNRKAVVEQRLELLNKDISGVRMQLKRVGIK